MTTTQGLSTLRSSALTFLKNRPNSGPARLAGESVKWRHPWWVWPGIQSVNLHGLTEPLFACKHFKSPKSHSFHMAFNLCQAVCQAHSVWSQESWENHCAASKEPSESDWKSEQVLKAQTVMLKGHHCTVYLLQNTKPDCLTQGNSLGLSGSEDSSECSGERFIRPPGNKVVFTLITPLVIYWHCLKKN